MQNLKQFEREVGVVIIGDLGVRIK